MYPPPPSTPHGDDDAMERLGHRYYLLFSTTISLKGNQH